MEVAVANLDVGHSTGTAAESLSIGRGSGTAMAILGGDHDVLAAAAVRGLAPASVGMARATTAGCGSRGLGTYSSSVVGDDEHLRVPCGVDVGKVPVGEEGPSQPADQAEAPELLGL